MALCGLFREQTLSPQHINCHVYTASMYITKPLKNSLCSWCSLLYEPFVFACWLKTKRKELNKNSRPDLEQHTSHRKHYRLCKTNNGSISNTKLCRKNRSLVFYFAEQVTETAVVLLRHKGSERVHGYHYLHLFNQLNYFLYLFLYVELAG